jgi:hypothetical protein
MDNMLRLMHYRQALWEKLGSYNRKHATMSRLQKSLQDNHIELITFNEENMYYV